MRETFYIEYRNKLHVKVVNNTEEMKKNWMKTHTHHFRGRKVFDYCSISKDSVNLSLLNKKKRIEDENLEHKHHKRVWEREN